jgi:hypothetical protein
MISRGRPLVLAMLAAVAGGAAVAAPPASAPAEPAGMEILFNGRDLAGWEGDPRLWSVKDGVIRGETTPELTTNDNTFLIWQGGDVEDFDLRFAFRCSASNNSGVQYRSRHMTEASAKNKWVVCGYQCECRNQNTPPDTPGFIYDEKGGRKRMCLAGERVTWEADGGKRVLGSLMEAEELANLVRLDDWNDVIIRAEGNHMCHWLNGRLVMSFIDDDPARALEKGIVALQLHAGAPMWTEFRDLRLKRLP